MNSKSVDIIIVGAGAIGSALALALGRMGWSVALVDAAKQALEPADPERVVALSHGSREWLDRLGVWQDVASHGVGMIRHIEVRQSRAPGAVRLDTVEAHRIDPQVEALGYVVQMHELLEPMQSQFPENVIFDRPARAVALETDGDSISLHLKRDGRAGRHCGRLLIGADGTESSIRRLAGIDRRGWDHNRFALVASIECSAGHADTAWECFQPEGPLAFLPMADGRYSIVWALPPRDAADLLHASERIFIESLQQAAGSEVIERTGRLGLASKRAVFPLEMSLAARLTAPRLALAGNAAHTLHPVAGQGMNLGFRDAAVLCDILARARAKDRDPGSMILLEEYAERRLPDIAVFAAATESLLGIFEPDLLPLRMLRGLALKGLDLCAPLRQRLLREAAGMGRLATLELGQAAISPGETG